MKKIKFTRLMMSNYNDLDTLKSLENKLLLPSDKNMLLMLTNVSYETVEEKYGRKENKTRQVTYLYCDLRGYNRKGSFVGLYDADIIAQYLEMYEFHRWRTNYIGFAKQWDLMHAEQEKAVKRTKYGSEWMSDVITAIEEEKMLMATKIYMEVTGKGLKESKDAVFALRDELETETKNQ